MTPVAATELVAGDARRRSNSSIVTARWWLLDDGVPVAFLQVIHRPNENETSLYPQLSVCDIEVRESVRGRGFAREIIGKVQDVYGATLHTSGSYTPLGFAALAAHLPLSSTEPAAVRFEDMAFVRDWDNMVARFPL